MHGPSMVCRSIQFRSLLSLATRHTARCYRARPLRDTGRKTGAGIISCACCHPCLVVAPCNMEMEGLT